MDVLDVLVSSCGFLNLSFVTVAFNVLDVLAILALKCFSVRVSTCRVTFRNVLSMVRVGQGTVDVKIATAIHVFVSVCGVVSVCVV